MPVKLGVNPLRLHCLLKALDAGRIRPVELGVNLLRLHCLLKALDVSQIGCKSIEIDAGQIGCKSIEITLPIKGFRLPVKFDRLNWV